MLLEKKKGAGDLFEPSKLVFEEDMSTIEPGYVQVQLEMSLHPGRYPIEQ